MLYQNTEVKTMPNIRIYGEFSYKTQFCSKDVFTFHRKGSQRCKNNSTLKMQEHAYQLHRGFSES
jgi:hypothetical protein